MKNGTWGAAPQAPTPEPPLCTLAADTDFLLPTTPSPNLCPQIFSGLFERFYRNHIECHQAGFKALAGEPANLFCNSQIRSPLRSNRSSEILYIKTFTRIKSLGLSTRFKSINEYFIAFSSQPTHAQCYVMFWIFITHLYPSLKIF